MTARKRNNLLPYPLNNSLYWRKVFNKHSPHKISFLFTESSSPPLYEDETVSDSVNKKFQHFSAIYFQQIPPLNGRIYAVYGAVLCVRVRSLFPGTNNSTQKCVLCLLLTLCQKKISKGQMSVADSLTRSCEPFSMKMALISSCKILSLVRISLEPALTLSWWKVKR